MRHWCSSAHWYAFRSMLVSLSPEPEKAFTAQFAYKMAECNAGLRDGVLTRTPPQSGRQWWALSCSRFISALLPPPEGRLALSGGWCSLPVRFLFCFYCVQVFIEILPWLKRYLTYTYLLIIAICLQGKRDVHAILSVCQVNVDKQ